MGSKGPVWSPTQSLSCSGQPAFSVLLSLQARFATHSPRPSLYFKLLYFMLRLPPYYNVAQDSAN